jgi:hypothetical protein
VSEKPRLLSERCATCVFRPGNRMRLAPGRLAQLVEHHRATGSLLICHDTLSYGTHPEFGEAMCRGYFDAYADPSRVAQIMTVVFGPDWYDVVDPPGSTDDDVNGTVGGVGPAPPEEL